MYDEDEMPNDLTNPIILHKLKEHMPSHMQDMIKYLPQELPNNFKTLLTPTKQIHQGEVHMPNHKITCSMTQKQRMVALVVKAVHLKVGEALKSSHSHYMFLNVLCLRKLISTRIMIAFMQLWISNKMH
jgi:hypothetical protein